MTARRYQILAPLVVLTACGLGLPVRSTAHGPLHEQIQRLTQAIQQYPDSADLYLQRGELHRHHQDWPAALRDYDAAARRDPALATVALCRGKMFLDAQNPLQAKAVLDDYLAKAPADGEGLVTRARAFVQLGKYISAAEDFTRAIAHTSAPPPEYYIERAQAEVAAGRLEEAVRGIDEGMQRLGQIVTLELCAIDLEIRAQHYDEALQRLEKVAAQSPRKEKWLVRRAEILQLAGREAEARQTYQAALSEISALPAQRRNTKAVADLEKRIRLALGK